MIRPNLIHPDPRLKKLCDPVGTVTPEIGRLADDMLEMLFLAPQSRGQGLGRSFVQLALAQGVRRVDVNEQNPAALAFYERLGFVRRGRSPLDGQGRAFPLLHLEWAG